MTTTRACQLVLALAAAAMLVSCDSGTESGTGGSGKRKGSPAGPKEVVVLVTAEQMKVIESLPDGLVCFTPAKRPVTTLEGLTDDQFAAWVGGDMPQKKLMTAFGRKDTVIGLRMMGTGKFSFAEESELRLFVTYEKFAGDIVKGGGARIKFKQK